MRDLIIGGRELLLDFASTLMFLILFQLTGSVAVSVGVGMALGAAQIGWRIAHKKPVDSLQWASFGLVLVAGAATLVTHNPLFVMLKPSVIYVIVGLSMLKRGWMDRYMPPIALEKIPNVVVAFGYVWAGLMFFSAVLNVAVAMSVDVHTWAGVMTAWGFASKTALFFIQAGVMKFIGHRLRQRRLAMTAGISSLAV